MRTTIDLGDADAPAVLRYQLAYGSWLLPNGRKDQQAWHLVRKVIDPDTQVTLALEAVAIFNLDSEGKNFQRYLVKTAGKVEIDPELAELFELERRSWSRV